MADWLDVIDEAGSGHSHVRESLLSVAEEVSNSGSWAWKTGVDQLVWSANLQRLWQLEPRPGQRPLSALLERVTPSDQRRIRGWIDWVRSGHRAPDIKFRIVLPDGGVRHMDARAARREDEDGRVYFVGWVQDVTDTRQAERELACHLAVTSVLNEWNDAEEGIMRLLEGLAQALGLHRTALWIPRADGQLEPRWMHDEPGTDGVALNGRVLADAQRCAAVAWRAREPIWVGGIRDEPGFPIGDQASWDTLRNAVLVPLTSRGESLAVLALPGVQELEITDRLMTTLAGIGTEIGAFLSSHTSILQPPVLTPREIEILRLASEGLAGPAIAARLYVSPATIKTHFENIYAKYGVTDRVTAVAKAIREGLLR